MSDIRYLLWPIYVFKKIMYPHTCTRIVSDTVSVLAYIPLSVTIYAGNTGTPGVKKKTLTQYPLRSFIRVYKTYPTYFTRLPKLQES
jgi:hypothetical protein